MSALDDRSGADAPLSWVYGIQPVAPPTPSKRHPSSVDADLPFAFREVLPSGGGPVRLGEPWRVNGSLIVPCSSGAGDVTGNTVEVAEGIDFTPRVDESGAFENVDVVTFNVPNDRIAIVEEARIRCESEMGYLLVEFAIVVGGGSGGRAQSGAVGRSFNRSQTLRPIEYDEPIMVYLRLQPGSTVRLQATNTSGESVHVVWAALRGSLFPASALEGR